MTHLKLVTCSRPVSSEEGGNDQTPDMSFSKWAQLISNYTEEKQTVEHEQGSGGQCLD